MLLLAAISCMMVAKPGTPDSKKKKNKTEKTETVDSVGDSVFVDSLGNEIKPKLKQADDTTQMDSLQKAIWKHNKVVDDSIRLDSIARKKQGGVDAPVNYQADDSLVYDALSYLRFCGNELGRDLLTLGIDLPVLLIQIEFRNNVDQLHIGFPVGAQSPHILPVAVILVCEDPPAVVVAVGDNVLSEVTARLIL